RDSMNCLVLSSTVSLTSSSSMRSAMRLVWKRSCQKRWSSLNVPMLMGAMVARLLELVHRVHDRETAPVLDGHAFHPERRPDPQSFDLATAEEYDGHGARLVGDRAFEARAPGERFDAHGTDASLHADVLPPLHVPDPRPAVFGR